MVKEQKSNRLQIFLSLGWYEETIRFVFNFVTKTSELLLAAGVVISTANFLTDGDVMNHNKGLSDAWSWAQALAIDSSLGIVLMNAFQALREREKIKAVIFFTLTALLAIVAGLITHFDALGHATGLPATDTSISGIIPLWVMTALRSVAVIGFLLAARLKNFSFNTLHQEWKQTPVVASPVTPEPPAPSLDYTALATALVDAMRGAGALPTVRIREEGIPLFPGSPGEETQPPRLQQRADHEEATTVRIARAYEDLRRERSEQNDKKPISARDLARRANVRRTTCSEWLKQQETLHNETTNGVLNEGDVPQEERE